MMKIFSILLAGVNIFLTVLVFYPERKSDSALIDGWAVTLVTTWIILSVLSILIAVIMVIRKNYVIAILSAGSSMYFIIDFIKSL